MQYPFLKYADIEHEATKLLFEYETKYGEITSPAIPIEDIIELHLKLAVYPIEEETDILGYININKEVIYINDSLYPDDPFTKAGRYNFTLAHEVAHWTLHAPIVKASQSNLSFIDDLESNEVILCRSSEGRAMIERQADYFAGALLIQTHLLKKQWLDFTGKPQPLFLDRVAASVTSRLRNNRQMEKDVALQLWARELAQAFNVSSHAMVVRLKQVGLLLETSNNLSLAI